LGLSLTAASTTAGSVCIGIALFLFFLRCGAPGGGGNYPAPPPGVGPPPIDIIGPDWPRPGRQSAAREPRRTRGSLPVVALIAPQPCIRWNPLGDPNHDAVMRIGGEAPRRRAHSLPRHRGQGWVRVTAASDRLGTASRRGRINAGSVSGLSGCSSGLSRQFAHVAGLNTAPAGTSPVVT
jgi:hypothetical protein